MAQPRFLDPRDLSRVVHVFDERGEKPRGITPDGRHWSGWGWSAEAGPREQYLGAYTLGTLTWF